MRFFRRPFRIISTGGEFLRGPIGIATVLVLLRVVWLMLRLLVKLILLEQPMTTQKDVAKLEHFQLVSIGQMGTG